MLAPARLKWRKQNKGRNPGMATRGQFIAFGEYGLQAIDRGRVSARQLEAARIAMTRFIKRGGKVWMRVFPDKGLVKKPAETRMGHGKGAVELWVVNIKPARILFEMEGVTEAIAREAFRLASHKLPIKTKFISRHGSET
jgi:large subunit ribosomal protein L16